MKKILIITTALLISPVSHAADAQQCRLEAEITAVAWSFFKKGMTFEEFLTLMDKTIGLDLRKPGDLTQNIYSVSQSWDIIDTLGGRDYAVKDSFDYCMRRVSNEIDSK